MIDRPPPDSFSAPSRHGSGRLLVVGGGVRSGKSAFALSTAETRGPRRLFIATAPSDDTSMRERIARHQRDRADRYTTLECPLDLVEALAQASGFDVAVIDCLTLWISNMMMAGLDDTSILRRVDSLVEATRASSLDVIVVTNEVGLGLLSMSDVGRRFQDLTGWAHQALARTADEIYLAALGCIVRLRPAPLLLVSP